MNEWSTLAVRHTTHITVMHIVNHSTTRTPHVKYRLVYVTVVDKTKYSTIARRTPLLATAPNMKNTYNGRMFVGAEGTFTQINSYTVAAETPP